MSVYSCSSSLNKYLLSVNKPSRAGDLQVSPKHTNIFAWVAYSTPGTAVGGIHGRASVPWCMAQQPLLSRPLKCTSSAQASLHISCADLLRLSLVPLGCPPASPAHPRECPRPGGTGQAPETSPSCCAQFQGSQGLAHCPWRLPALAPAFGTSWKNPGGPTPSHSLACLKPPPRPP